MSPLIIESVQVRDVRFPTGKFAHGSDAMHTDPDYSCAYVVIHIKNEPYLKGHGLAFTLGRGTEIVVQAIRTLTPLVVGEDCHSIWKAFGVFWRKLTSESQIRWIGPEKGVIHFAVAAIINALWDLWARFENKPLWKLLVDLSPEQLVSTIDFRYITDVVTPEECISMLKEKKNESEAERETLMKTKGFQAYTTQIGWIGYPDDLVQTLCKQFLSEGFTSFKIKVGQDIEDDKRRCALVRAAIGPNNNLMIDANQRWDVQQSIDWVTQLKEYKPLWIEEPTSPDDVLGHATIAKALKPYGIGVATGEMCQNRVMFKQLLQANAISFCQIDSCRVGGVNEVLSIYFMAKKLGVPVCPHAGGVGLCEMVQHLQVWDYVSLSAELDNRMVEYVDHLHEHFTCPPVIKHAHYIAPKSYGYSTEIKEKSIDEFEFPTGSYWTAELAKK